MRRSRAHKAGDHSLCKRCAAVRDAPPAPDLPPPADAIPSSDRGRLRWLATVLARAYRDDPGNALLARELRMTLQALIGGREGAEGRDDEIEDLFAEFSSA